MNKEEQGGFLQQETRGKDWKYGPIEERDVSLTVKGEPRECHIRSYLPDDAALIGTFIRSMTEDDLYMRYPCVATPERHVENAQKRLGTIMSDHFGVVALADGKVIAIVQAFEYGKDGFEVSLNTLEEFQRSGVGKILLDIIEEKIHATDRKKVIVEFKKSNAKMKGFAISNGFSYANTDDDMFIYEKAA